MNGNVNSVSPPAQDIRRWMVRVIQAVILGEAIWGLLVSLTHGLVLPALARFLGGNPQSVLLLGKGDFDVAAIFSSILELCIAGIAVLVLSYGSRPRAVRVRVKTVKRVPVGAAKTSSASISANGMPSILAAPTTPPPATAPPASVGAQAVATTTPTVPLIPPAASQATSPVAPTAASAKPVPPSKPAASAKPQKPKEVYYNIVGEPIYPTEDDN